jgi:hypothetical protein
MKILWKSLRIICTVLYIFLTWIMISSVLGYLLSEMIGNIGDWIGKIFFILLGWGAIEIADSVIKNTLKED